MGTFVNSTIIFYANDDGDDQEQDDYNQLLPSHFFSGSQGIILPMCVATPYEYNNPINNSSSVTFSPCLHSNSIYLFLYNI